MSSWIRACLGLVLMIVAAPRAASGDLVWALTGDNRLVVFGVHSPGTILRDIPISGLQTGETIRAIDFRPLDGQLYGYGSTHRIYRIHMLTGTATAISAAPLAIQVAPGDNLGFDFNPQTDQIRIITNTEQNFRVSPTTGAVIDGDTLTAGIQGDTPLTPVGNYVAAAYTNNYAGAFNTTLFAINAQGNRLARIGAIGGTPSPDLGVVHDIGPLGEATDQSAALDAALLPSNELYAHLSSVGLCNVHRQTGAVKITITIQDDEVPPNPPPTITITLPSTDPFLRASGLLATLGGTASDNTSVTSVTWSTDHGHSGTAQGTTQWLAPEIPLAFGTTLITVTATDTAGLQSTDTIELDVQNVEYLLAEGATGQFFDTDILLANPNAVPAPISLSFLKEGGGIVNQTMTLPATSRTTVHVDQIPGLESTAVSTRIESDAGLPLVVERTMRWDGTGYGAHTEKAVGEAARFWYFAEGSQGFFYTYLLLVNPLNVDTLVRVRYLREGTTTVLREYRVPSLARVTVDAGADPELVNTSFGMIVDFGVEKRGVAERAMYFGTNPLWKAGHESAGVTMPAQEWFLAEGATGPFFETFVLLSNPQTTPATVTVKYLRAGAPPITKTKTVPASGRFTINVEGEDPGLSNAAFGTQISSTVPIVVERAQYWASTPDQWYEAHNSFGILAAATKWGLAEGRVGGPNNYQTYILLANPSTQTADVTIVFLRTNGTTVTKTFSVAAASRFNVAPGPGGPVPELVNEEFSAVITSTQPIVVERAMYLDAGGTTWSAGTNATATRLP